VIGIGFFTVNVITGDVMPSIDWSIPEQRR
jgi:hypothetical protein